MLGPGLGAIFENGYGLDSGVFLVRKARFNPRAISLVLICLLLASCAQRQMPPKAQGRLEGSAASDLIYLPEQCLQLPEAPELVVFIGGAADNRDWTSYLHPSTHLMDWIALRTYSGHFGPGIRQRYPARVRIAPGVRNGPRSFVQRLNYFGYEQYEQLVDWLLSQELSRVDLVGHSRGGAAALRLTQDPRLAHLQFPVLLTLDPVKENIFRRRGSYQPGARVELAINIHRPAHVLRPVAELPLLGNGLLLLASSVQQVLPPTGHYTNVSSATGGELSPIQGMNNYATHFHHVHARHMFMQWAMQLCH